jgi:methylated-DNA-[protein]-cysteine S-methyltransferase
MTKGRTTRAATIVDSPIGHLYLSANDAGLTELSFLRKRSERRAVVARATAAQRIVREVERQLSQYFAGRRRDFDLPLAPAGTEFQLATWKELCEVPFGETISYGELARRIGRPRAVRAVGAANGANPISIIVPCHRVIGADGRLVGYGGGLPVKRALLRLEGIELEEDRRKKLF